MWLHGGQSDETPIATAAEGVGSALSSAVGAVMMFTAGSMICLLVGSDSFAPETPKTALSTPADAMVRQWCMDARKRLELAEAMQTAETAHQARVDANLLCAKAGS
ncbi:MAG TPA: hypothetical protein VGO52_02635 [Hyphomonadaceae bacterium]|jgi:hypothetical protein|nr:hypothetical protein [Hyphomonadaceae bacterium]